LYNECATATIIKSITAFLSVRRFFSFSVFIDEHPVV
jgi:hypothetical protein